MRQNSITFKLLAPIISVFVISTVSVLFVQDIQLTRILDKSQNAMYAEKIETIWGDLDRKNALLHKTGLVEAYVEDFEEASLKILRQTYYKQANQSIFPFIIDTDGKVVMHPTLPKGDLSLGQTKIVKTMLASSQGDFTFTLLGETNWCLFKKFPAWNWVIGYTVPLNFKYRDAKEFRNILICILSGITLLVLLLLSLFVTRFTSPIVKLTKLARAMGDGDLDQQIDLGGTDEVGTLALSFSHMRDSIRDKISELEKDNIEREKTETALRESEAVYRSLVENINMGIALIDRDHNIIMANNTRGSILGKSANGLTGKKCYQEFESRVQVCSHCLGESAMETRAPQSVILQRQREDGTKYAEKIRAIPLQDDNGKANRFIEVVEDITEQLKTQQDLAAEKEWLEIGRAHV